MSRSVSKVPTSPPSTIRPPSLLHHTLGDVTRTFRLLRQNRTGFIGLVLVVTIVVVSLVLPLFIPLDTTNRLTQVYAPPSWEFPLGTDFQGRSVWPEVLHGGRQAILVGVLASVISTTIAVSLGSFSAIVGGRVDRAIVAFADIVLALPLFILLLIIAAIYRPTSVLFLAFVLGLLTWPALLRAVRAQTLSIRERDFIEAARALGLSRRHLIVSEVAPNMAGFVLISFILGITSAMIQQVNLVALGLVPLTGNNWAITLFEANQRGAIYFTDSLAYILGPIVAIVAFQFGLILLTRSLEQIFNPRLRGSR